MSNIIKIKHGSNPPTSDNIDSYELGFSESDNGLYTKKSNEEVVKLNETIQMSSIFDILYPVNSIYFTSDKNFNPNEAENWYGTWEKISGYYLYLDEENTGDFAGDAENPFSVKIQDHILDETTMPPHTHNLNSINIDGASAGTPSGNVSGNIGGSSSASHSHSLSGTATSGGGHRHGIPEVITTSSTGRVQAGTNRHWTNSSSLSTDYGGSHTHTLSGTANSASVTIYGSNFDLNASFSGNTLPEHTHTASGSVDSSGEGNAIPHEVVSKLNIPRFNILCWRRTA